MKLAEKLWRRWPLELAAIWLLAALSRLPFLGRPRATVFDEVYFFHDFVGGYYTHHYYFDIHPPLGKLILAGWTRLFGASAATFNAAPAASARLLIAICGTLVAPLVYGIVRRLCGSRLAAGLAGLFVALDGALIVESRFVLTDSILLLFGLGAIYAALRWQAKPSRGWLATTGLLMGAAASIKWTGLAPDLVAALILVKGLRDTGAGWRRWALSLAAPAILAAALYLSAFAVHFALLTHSGSGDAFMSRRFQATLIGSPSYDPHAHLSFWQKTWELNREMFRANRTLTAGHPYGSKWYTWPLELRPVYYWQGPPLSGGRQGNIYLLGNPLIWWPAALAAAAAILMIAIPRWRRLLGGALPAFGLLIFAYLLNWLPFAGITRVMFLYHYLFAFIFSAMMLAVLAARVIPARNRRRAAITLAVLSLAGFVFFAPITYGLPLSPGQLQARVWLPGWR